MFSSNEAGRTAALGVAMSVCGHLVLGWVVSQYVSVGDVRQLDLRGTIRENGREVDFELQDRRPGNVGDSLALRNGTTSTVGPRSGESGAPSDGKGDPAPADRATGESAPDTPDDEAVDPGDADPSSAPSEQQTSEARAPEPTIAAGGASAAQSGEDDQQNARSGDEAVAPEPTERRTSDEASEEATDEQDDPASRAKRADGEPKSARPTFSSLEGDRSEGSGASGEGDGSGKLGGVSVALIDAVFAKHQKELLRCYARLHDYTSGGTERIVTALELGTEGAATGVTTRYRTTNRRVANCMTDRIGEWTFPELDEPATFVKTITIDANIKAKWLHPAEGRRLSE